MATTPEKILVRGVNWLGDAVMSTPALARLREAKPDAEIVLLTPEKLSGLWEGHPAINRIMTFTAAESVMSVGRRLRAEGFGTAVIFPNSPRSALEAFLAGVPARLGDARPRRSGLLTRAVPPRADEVRMHKRSPREVRALAEGRIAADKGGLPPRSHHMFQYLHLVELAGARGDAMAPMIAVTAEEVKRACARFGTGGLGAGSGTGGGAVVIGINAGAEYGPAKRWPVAHFVEAGAKLGEQLNCVFWIFGGASDRELSKEVATGLRARGVAEDRVRLLAGETSLRELCAALKACDVVLTNDTGPMHVAAAVGTRVVVPFGSTSWRMTGPGFPGDPGHRFLDLQVPCSPCFRRDCPIDFRCMTGITPEMAVQAVLGVVAA
jgi:heptosyltransferase-2